MTLDSVKKGSVRFDAKGRNEDGSPAIMDSAYVSKEALKAAGHDPGQIKEVRVSVEVIS